MSQRLLLINDTSASLNQGSLATTHALNAEIARLYPDFEIDRIGSRTVMSVAADPAGAAFLPEGPDDLTTAARALMSTKFPDAAVIADSIRSADIVVFNFEGSIGENRLTRELSPHSAFLFAVVEAAASLDKPVHFINGTMHLTKEKSRALARPALEKCATVTVREPFSYFYVKQVCDRVKLFPDIVCSIEPTKGESATGDAYAMIGGSSAQNAYPRNAKLPRPVRQQYVRTLEIVQKLGLRVKLMGWYRDDFLREFEGDGAEFVECDFWKYSACAAGARFNFTGRHHGIVMSFRAGCPFSAISANSYKTEGDSRLYGGVGPVENFDRMDLVRVEQTLRRMNEQHAELRAAGIARRDAMRPFFAGALENTVQPITDLVEAGLYQPSENETDYVYHAWHNRTISTQVGRVLSRMLGGAHA